MDQNELASYLNDGIHTIVSTVQKKPAFSFRELLFLASFKYASKRAGKKRLSWENRGTHIPAFLIASITNSCNLFCKGCYARANGICKNSAPEEKNERRILTAEKWNDLFTQADNIGISFCLLAGGEPMLRSDVLAAAAQHHTIIFPVFTNGTLFNKERLCFFDQHRNIIPVISREGNRNTTDERRGQGTFDAIQNTTEQFSKRNLLWGTSVTVTTQNIGEITETDFIRPLYKQGCRIVFYIEYVPVAPGSEHLAPQDKERVQLATAVDKLRGQFPGLVILSFPGDEKYMGGCLAGGRGFFHINPYGSAEPCPFSPYSDTDVIHNSILDVLNSSFFTKLRSQGLTGSEHSGGCALYEQQSSVAALITQHD
jgi:MoaA/NifB/PqqE/SkfB family radical SAM enzyme